MSSRAGCGIEDEVVDEALDEIDQEAEVEAARELVRRKLRRVARLDHEVAARRLVGMLARKGHSPGVAFRVVREELARSDGGAAELSDGFVVDDD
jgi:regulatory protein